MNRAPVVNGKTITMIKKRLMKKYLLLLLLLPSVTWATEELGPIETLASIRMNDATFRRVKDISEIEHYRVGRYQVLLNQRGDKTEVYRIDTRTGQLLKAQFKVGKDGLITNFWSTVLQGDPL